MKKIKRDNLVTFYAYMIMRGHAGTNNSFKDLNIALMEYWSPAALEYILNKAWRIANPAFPKNPFNYIKIKHGESPSLTICDKS